MPHKIERQKKCRLQAQYSQREIHVAINTRFRFSFYHFRRTEANVYGSIQAEKFVFAFERKKFSPQ